MDTPLRQGARTRDRPTWTPRPLAESYIGRSLADGRFMIRQPIAEGGMSLVFLADDRQDGRPVAIKICRDDDPDSSIGRRFAWESRVLANLQHPNLVSVLATGETHSVREFVELAFAQTGRTIAWSGAGADEIGRDAITGEALVLVDPRYFRPTEVDELRGDPTKAREKLGWRHTTSFRDLVAEMVAGDREAISRETGRHDHSTR